jgi:hypothetical protein
MLALYAPAIFFDGLLQKSVLDVFFVCLALWLIAELNRGGRENAEKEGLFCDLAISAVKSCGASRVDDGRAGR